MSWALPYIEKLKRGENVRFRPHGNSMLPKIKSGQLIEVCPIEQFSDELEKNHIVLCKVNGKYYVHLISAIKNSQYQISNNHSSINGWISKNNIFGVVVEIFK